MTKFNSANTRIKYIYREHLKESEGIAEASLDTIDKAIARFEEYTNYKDFKTFHQDQAIAFKKHLAKQKAELTGKPLSISTMHSTLRHLKSFFRWLSREPGYKSSIRYRDADYFNMSRKDSAVANAKHTKACPTLEQIRHVLSMMPFNTDIERRDRALLALTTSTGVRDKAITTIKLKHLDVIRGCLLQDAREVATKRSKTFDTYFLPVGDDIKQIVVDWYWYLRKELLWSDSDPLFPSTLMGLTVDRQFGAIGLSREHWKTTEPVRRIFKQSFQVAGLPYYNPHSFRNTLVRLGQRVCTTAEEFKAWSQNFGHEEVMTTFTSYGEVPVTRQGEIIAMLEKRLKGD